MALLACDDANTDGWRGGRGDCAFCAIPSSMADICDGTAEALVADEEADCASDELAAGA